MPESSNKPFVVTDRRKFTKDGDLRPDAQPSTPAESPVAQAPPPVAAVPPPPPPPTPFPAPQASPEDLDPEDDASLPAPTAEQIQQARSAYEATADRIDLAIRSANPGGDHPPKMNFDQLIQSLYLTAIMQLGGATPEGEKPRVDILGARQSIDMLAVVGDKSAGNLSDMESKLLESALFELRIAFLEITQSLARSAQAQSGFQPGGPQSGPQAPRGPGKPGIIL